jgi:predicted transcriptional regulator
MNNLRNNRNALGLSQSKLARLSGVSRFKICTFELGDTTLSENEQDRVIAALQAEAARLREIPPIDLNLKAASGDEAAHV